MTYHRPATELPERLPPWANATKERDWVIKEALARPGWYDAVLARVDRGPECHLWTGYTARNGYGRVKVPGGRFHGSVHRVVYLATHGDIPLGHVIDHTCNVKACCNPAHLEAVTPRENSARATVPSWYAVNAAKTHCKRGHPLAGENLLTSDARRGYRSCRTCSRDRKREVQRLLREAAAHVGMTQLDYRERFGGSAEDARLILAGEEPRLDHWRARCARPGAA
jgi:hypothetical protein